MPANPKVAPLESVNEFSLSLWQDIDTAISRAIQQANSNSERPVAVFDADGTLWDHDAGEAFFDWQLRHCQIRGLPPDPWAHYRTWKKKDPHGAYGWLAQLSAGAPLEAVHDWARACKTEHSPWPVFRSMKMLIDRLRNFGVDIFIVSASVKWAVEPFAYDLLGIPFDHVLGVETETVNVAGAQRIVTDLVKMPITYRQGKIQALLRASGGRKPFLAAGNSIGDIALLDAATDMKLMIQSQSSFTEGGDLALSEKKLREYGRPLGWQLHAFRS